jgi:hypothetical protein
VRYEGPRGANIIVEVNGHRLRPANHAYYQGDGILDEYDLDQAFLIDPSTFNDNDIEVYLNGVRQRQGIEYEIIDGSMTGFDNLAYDARSFDVAESGITVKFAAAPLDGDRVTISYLYGAEFRMNNDSQIEISELVSRPPSSSVVVHSFSNHDNLRIRTQVFVGHQDWYQLSRVCQRLSHLWVTVNGVRLFPGYDFSINNGDQLIFGQHVTVGANSVIAVTHFTEQLQARSIAFRIRHDTRGMVEYLRISDQETTILTQDLGIDDEEIHVQDARLLSTPDPERAIPGVIYINKERITYYTVDRVNNVLGQIRRGTGGTGAVITHAAGSRVVDAGQDQRIPTQHRMVKTPDRYLGESYQTQNDRVWYDTAKPDQGLQFADTAAARFLQRRYAFYLA